jgi:phosphatidylinositol phospholipase C gamma-1
MWANHGRFQQNGRCGFVLKPLPMLSPDFDPHNHKTYKVDPASIRIKVISGRHLVKAARGVASPFVEIELLGIDKDKYKTRTIPDNGLGPVWMEPGESVKEGEICEFTCDLPDLACLQFVVQDEDMFGDANVIGQNVYPLGQSSESSIRTGYRSIQLKNPFNEPLELSSLLVHISYEENKSQEYQSLQELRQQLRLQEAKREDLVKKQLRSGDSSDIQALQQVNHQIVGLETQIMHNPVEQARVKGKKVKPH